MRIQDFSNKLLLQWEKIFSQDISIIKARSINHTGGFSVCIPHHNRLDHLKFAVRSVLMQGADVREILIYNDPLEDKSKSGKIRQKLERMKMNWRHKVPLHIIYGESNKGPSNARNRMAERASGEFLFFLDDDNQLKPSALRDLRRVLSNKSYDIVLSSLNRIGPSGMADGPASSVWPPVGEDISMNLFYNLIRNIRKGIAVK